MELAIRTGIGTNLFVVDSIEEVLNFEETKTIQPNRQGPRQYQNIHHKTQTHHRVNGRASKKGRLVGVDVGRGYTGIGNKSLGDCFLIVRIFNIVWCASRIYCTHLVM